MSGVEVNTVGDYSTSLECGQVLIEFNKDGDSPACPKSWTHGIWYDGNYIDGCEVEMSLARSVKDAIQEVDKIIREFEAIRDFLTAYGAFGKEPAGIEAPND